MLRKPAHALIHFTHAVVNSSEHHTDNEHMVSEVFFASQVDTRIHSQSALVKLAAGADYAAAGLEVVPGRRCPCGSDPNLHAQELRDRVAEYMESLIGPQANIMRLGQGAQVTIEDCAFQAPATTSVPVLDRGGPGW